MVATGRISTYPSRSKYRADRRPAGAGRGRRADGPALGAQVGSLPPRACSRPPASGPRPTCPRRSASWTRPPARRSRTSWRGPAERFPRPVLLGRPGPGRIGPGRSQPRSKLNRRVTVPGRAPTCSSLLAAAGSWRTSRCQRRGGRPRAAAVPDPGHPRSATRPTPPITDHAADRRAPTPTAAAEIAVPGAQASPTNGSGQLDQRVFHGMQRELRQRAQRLGGLGAACRPGDLLGQAAQRLDDLAERLPHAHRRVERCIDQVRGLRPASAPLPACSRKQRPASAASSTGSPTCCAAICATIRVSSSARPPAWPWTSCGRACPGTATLAGLGDRQEGAGGRRLRDAARGLRPHRPADSLSYEGVLARGFVLVRHKTGARGAEAARARSQTALHSNSKDGRVPTLVPRGRRAKAGAIRRRPRPPGRAACCDPADRPPSSGCSAVRRGCATPTRLPLGSEQDFSTIAPYTIEEAYEVADAIARDDSTGLEDELGDLLLQVVYHAQMAKEAGLFDFDEVAARHRRQDGRAAIRTCSATRGCGRRAQSRAWEAAKAGSGGQGGRGERTACSTTCRWRCRR